MVTKAFKALTQRLNADSNVGFTDSIRVLSSRVKDNHISAGEFSQLRFFLNRSRNHMSKTTRDVFVSVMTDYSPRAAMTRLTGVEPGYVFNRVSDGKTFRIDYIPSQQTPDGTIDYTTIKQGYGFGTCAVLAALPLARLTVNDNGTVSAKLGGQYVTSSRLVPYSLDAYEGRVGVAGDIDAQLFEKLYAVYKGGWDNAANGNSIPVVLSELGASPSEGVGGGVSVVATERRDLDVVPLHAYRVLSLGETVRLFNPWGDTETVTKEQFNKMEMKFYA